MRCGRWDELITREYGGYYETWENTEHFGLSTTEEYRVFNFTRTFDHSGEYVKISDYLRMKVSLL